MKNNKILLGVKSFALVMMVICFSSVIYTIFGIDTSTISDKRYVVYYTLSNVLLLSIYFVIFSKTLIRDAKEYFKNFGKNFETSLKYWFIGYAIMIVSNLVISFVFKKTIAGNEEAVRSYINAFPILMIFDVSVYAPFVEELTFRKSIRDVINNKWCYVLASGLLFGLLHIIGYIDNVSDLIYLIPYGSLGVCFALLYYKTDNIFSSIVVHSLHNSIAIFLYLVMGGVIWKSL